MLWDTPEELVKQDGSQLLATCDPDVLHGQSCSAFLETVFLGPSTFFNTKQSLKQQEALSLFHVIISSNTQEQNYLYKCRSNTTDI